MPDISFQLRSVYSFDIYPTALIGTIFNNVTVLSIMDPSSAAKEVDIQALHIQIFPTLPAGTPNDCTAYDYVKVRTAAGQTIILGMAWINAATVTLVTANTITAVITGVSTADIPRIMNALVQNGYNNVNISIN